MTAHLGPSTSGQNCRRPPKQWVQGLIRQTWHMGGSAFAKAINDLDEETFQSLYGRWDTLKPAQVADLLSTPSVRWWIAGGRAARVGAPPRHHDDTDVAVRIKDLGDLRSHLSDWHLWEANSGTLRPLLPGDHLTEGCEQLWARRDAQHPWRLDLVLDRSGEDGWVFKRDARIRVPWERALHAVTAFRICDRRLRCCTRPTSTGPKTGRTWLRPGSIPMPGPGWRMRWSSLATTPGRTLREPARATPGPHTKET